MIFLRYEGFREYIRRYPVTTFILIVNLLLFVWMSIVGSSLDDRTLIRFGAIINVPPHHDEIWRYVTALFIHIGIEHLLFNSFALFVFAPPLEQLLGKWKYALFYLASGFFGNAVSELLQNEPHIAAGASVSIYGIYAAYIFIAIFRKSMLDRHSRTTITTIVVIGILHSIWTPQISLLGHLGGFAAGFIIYGFLAKKG
jgi:rhomboid protease GluP